MRRNILWPLVDSHRSQNHNTVRSPGELYPHSNALRRPVRYKYSMKTLDRDSDAILHWVNNGKETQVSSSRPQTMIFKRLRTHPTHCWNRKRFKKFYTWSMSGFLPITSPLDGRRRPGLPQAPAISWSVSNSMYGVTPFQVVRTWPGIHPLHQKLLFTSSVKRTYLFWPKIIDNYFPRKNAVRFTHRNQIVVHLPSILRLKKTLWVCYRRSRRKTSHGIGLTKITRDTHSIGWG